METRILRIDPPAQAIVTMPDRLQGGGRIRFSDLAAMQIGAVGQFGRSGASLGRT